MPTKEQLKLALDAVCQQYEDCVIEHGEKSPLCLTLLGVKNQYQQAYDEACEENMVLANTHSSIGWETAKIARRRFNYDITSLRP